MKRQDIQLFVANRVMESKMTKLAKLQMLNFIKEATEGQLMALALDGKITSLDEQAEQVVKDRFNTNKSLQESILNPVQEAGVIGNILGILFFSPLWWGGWRAILAANDKCQEKCGTFAISNSRDACVAKCQQQQLAKQTAYIDRASGAAIKKGKDSTKVKKAAMAAKIQLKQKAMKKMSKKMNKKK